MISKEGRTLFGLKVGLGQAAEKASSDIMIMPGLIHWRSPRHQAETIDWIEAGSTIVNRGHDGAQTFVLTDDTAQFVNSPGDIIASVATIVPTTMADRFVRAATSSSTTSATSVPSKGPDVIPKRTDTLAIVLGIVFGLVGVLLLVALAFFCIRRKRKHGSFMYQDNASVLSDDSFVGTGPASAVTNQKETSTASSSPERHTTYPVNALGIIEEKENEGRASPPNILGRTSPTKRMSSPSTKAEAFPPYYPPIPAAHQISSLVRRHSSEYSNVNDYAYIPNDPFEDINHGIYNQHLQQQHLQQQRVRSHSRASLNAAQSTTLEPLREYPENNDFQEPRNPLPADPRERSLYNYRDSPPDGRNSPGRNSPGRTSPGRNSPRQYIPLRSSVPITSSPLNPLPAAQPWPPRAIQHQKPNWPWPSNHPAAMGFLTPSKSMRAPEMLRYKKNNRRWTSEPHLLAHQSKMITRKPVPLPPTTPVPPLDKVKLPEFWWEQKYMENNPSVEELVVKREHPLRRFSFESRPESRRQS